MQVSLLGTLTSQFGNASHRLTLTFRLLDFALDDLGNILMDVQVVIDLLFDEVTYIFINGIPIGSHLRRAQLDLRLTLKDWFFHIDSDGSNDTRTDVAILVFTKELLDGLGDMLLESTLMGTTLRGMLAIDERVVLLTILVRVRESHLDILALQVDDRIERVVGHAVLQQVLQSVTAEDAATIIHNGQTSIQVGIVTQHILHDVVVERILFEQCIVWLKIDIGTILVLGILCIIRLQDASLKGGTTHLTIAIAGYLEVSTQRIDCLHTYTIQTY